ncbi:MAG TPA: hypothetical protein VNO30_40885 [Kofleriaceae bacterium]|nr:hypothetical protein [Kofleriaceae bacterium]
MIASRVTGLRSLFALLIATVAIAALRAWPAAPAPAVAAGSSAARPVTYRYVPLMGIPLDDAVDAADGDWENPPRETPAGPVQTCLPFLAPILAHPNWQLRITDFISHCTGEDIVGDFTIASTGEVTWSAPGVPVRHLALSGEQLALVRRLDQLSCVELQSDRHWSYATEWLSIGLDLGQHDPYTAARIAPLSDLGRAVTAMLADLTAQYRVPRREAIGSIELQLATTRPGPVYRVRIAGDRLTVKRGRKLLVDEEVESDMRVDLVDVALARQPASAHDLEGVLLMHGRSLPIALARHARSPFAQIHRAVDRAQYLEEERSP